MKEPLFPRHTATLLQYIGIGLISGAISHGFFSGFRSLVTAVIGIIVFVVGLAYERNLSGSKVDMGRVLLIGIVFSISTAMVAGGFQHFLDSPWRSAWIIPVGYFISLLVFREKEGIKNSFSDTFGRAVLVTGILFIICYPLARITPAQFDNHHGDGHAIVEEEYDKDYALREHCKQMPEMQGCEKFNNEGSSMSGMDHAMMDHGSMVTSEEGFVVNMIPHHQEAVDTARLVLAKGESAELKKLAQAIITAQEKEIAMMQKWSKDWNYSTVAPTYQNMMGDGTKLSGKTLDTWFLQGMIMHHEGAVQMAESLLKLDARKEVSDFARDVIRVQSSEISQMKLMLGDVMMMHRDSH
jgi:uncharacterized protein (DUF305 family)